MATMYYRPYFRPSSVELAKEDQMPDFDSLDKILPDYQYIFRDPASDVPTKRVPPVSPPDGARPTVGGPKPVNDGIRPSEDESSTAIGLLDYQRTELERYRYAVHKMGQDIVTLRQQMIELESNNSDLRRQNANYTDTTRLLQDAHELDGMPLPELAARYATLKQKFMQQTNQLRQYKQRVLELQNELIKKNDSMAGLLKMADAHEAQNTLMQRLQKKAVKLRAVEDVCKKQEKVIEKLEKLNTRGVETSDNKINEALKEENVRLRGHVDYLQDQVRASQKVDTKEDEQLLKLYEQLDKANARTTSLEKQMAENARQWGKEKSQLARKLREADLEREVAFDREAAFEREASPAPELRPLRQRRPPPDYRYPLTPPVSRRYSKAPPRRDRQPRNVWPLDEYLRTT